MKIISEKAQMRYVKNSGINESVLKESLAQNTVSDFVSPNNICNKYYLLKIVKLYK